MSKLEKATDRCPIPERERERERERDDRGDLSVDTICPSQRSVVGERVASKLVSHCFVLI